MLQSSHRLWAVLVSAMDKFGMHLAFNEDRAGKPLDKHSCMQYYRQTKHCLLDQFPQQRALLESRILEMGRMLENYCVKREGVSCFSIESAAKVTRSAAASLCEPSNALE